MNQPAGNEHTLALERVLAAIRLLDAAVVACRTLDLAHPARAALDDALIRVHDGRRALEADPAA